MYMWKELDLNRILENRIAENPGIYVIKQVDRVMGLPVNHNIIYVGKTKNLKRLSIMILELLQSHLNLY